MTIGDLAKQAGVNPQTIRFYERHGLIPKPKRESNGYRRYRAEDAERIRFIRAAKELGFTLQEIAELLSLRVHRGESCGRIRERATDKLHEIEGKLKRLKQMHRTLRQMIRACEGSRAVKDCAILGALKGPS